MFEYSFNENNDSNSILDEDWLCKVEEGLEVDESSSDEEYR